MLINPPPQPDCTPRHPRHSLIAYVWRGDKFDEIGIGLTQDDGHQVDLHLGVVPPEVIELRAIHEDFFPGQCRARELRPTFLVFLADTERRAGTAWPHEDGKGHRLKLREALPDGATIALRHTGDYMPGHGGQPKAKFSVRTDRRYTQ